MCLPIKDAYSGIYFMAVVIFVPSVTIYEIFTVKMCMILTSFSECIILSSIHHGVGQTKDTWRNIRCCTHIRGLSQWRRGSIPDMGSAPHSRSIIHDIANTMVACIVGIRLNYCNTLLHGAIEKSLKLQRVQNSSMLSISYLIIIGSHQKSYYIQGHTLCYKAYQFNQSSYLCTTLESYVQCHERKSAEMDLLTVSKSLTKTGVHRLFSVAPTIWNELSLADRIETFI